MDDTYAPYPVDSAECPHCRRVHAAVYGTNARVIEYQTMQLDCPDCGGEWDEMRRATGVGRHWEVPAPAGTAGYPGPGSRPATVDGRDGVP